MLDYQKLENFKNLTVFTKHPSNSENVSLLSSILVQIIKNYIYRCHGRNGAGKL